MEQLSGRLEKVSLFRPVVSEGGGFNKLIKLKTDLYDLWFLPEEMYGVTMEDAQSLLAVGVYNDLYSRILERYKLLESESDFVLCVGTNYSGLSIKVNQIGSLTETIQALMKHNQLLRTEGELGDLAKLAGSEAFRWEKIREYIETG